MSATTSRPVGMVVQLVQEGRAVVPVPGGTAAGGMQGGTQPGLTLGTPVDQGADAA